MASREFSEVPAVVPVAILRALYCIEESFWSNVWEREWKAWQPYSNLDLISDLYIFRAVFWSAPQLVPIVERNTFKSLLHLSTMSAMWGAQVRFVSKVRPRNFTCFFNCILLLFRCMFGSVSPLAFVGRKVIPTVLSVFMMKPHLFAHVWILFSVFCTSFVAVCMFLADVQSVASSAYLAVDICFGLFWNISSIIILKRVGLITLPCGVPFCNWYVSECWVPI